MEERIKALEETVKGLKEDVRSLTNVVYEMRQHIPGPIYSLGDLPLRGCSNAPTLNEARRRAGLPMRGGARQLQEVAP